MPKESTNLKLKLYNVVTDSTVFAKEWFNNVFDYTNSNWTKIDNAYKELLNSINNKVYSWNEITNKPDSIKNPNALTIQGNGTGLANYDGSEAKTVNITKDVIGLNNVDNTSDKNKKIEWGNILNKPNFVSSSILPYTMTYDGYYVGNGRNVYNTPVQIPISKEYDAICIIETSAGYKDNPNGRRSEVLRILAYDARNLYRMTAFIPLAGIPNEFTPSSDLRMTVGYIAYNSEVNSSNVLLRKTDSGLEIKVAVNTPAWNDSFNEKDVSYYIFGVNLNVTLE